MKEIELTQGQRAKVDDADFEWLNQWKWYAHWNPGTQSYYAVRMGPRGDRKRKTIHMHRIIMEAAEMQDVDHVHSGDTLNNKRDNLRLCTNAQNHYNQRKLSPASSVLKGVIWCKANHKWQAQIKLAGHQIHLGYFAVERDAALAYDIKARELFGKFALTNF